MKEITERLSETAKDVLAQHYFDKDFADLNEDQVEEMDCEDVTELWHHYLEYEADPEEVVATYYALFDQYHNVKLDVFDLVWGILLKLNPVGFNSAYAQVLAMTGRLGELKTYLEEFSNGIPKTE